MKFLQVPIPVVLLLLVLVGSPKAEAPGMIHGVVIEEGTKRPLLHARIRIPELNRQTFTDSAGNYRIDSLTSRTFSVQADGIGYLREIREVELPFPPHTFGAVGGPAWRPVQELNFYMRLRPTALY